MKTVLFLLLIGISMISFGQDKKTSNDSMCRLVQQYFNAKNSDSLYALGGADFKKAMGKEQFAAVCQNNLFPLGTMQAQYETFASGINQYKAVFAAATFTLYIGVDSLNKLRTFFLKPYIDEKKKTSAAATSNPLQSQLDKAVDSAAQPYISLAATHGVSIGILRNNEMYFYGYGEMADNNKKIPDEHTLFEIGSITKTFTATLLADAINEDKIKLSDPVNSYLPDSARTLQYEGTPVTIQMLSNHSSGIVRMPSNFDAYATDSLNPYLHYGEPQLFSFYKTYQLIRKPGSEYEYSNLAVATLGVILEHIYKKTFEQLVTEKICAPLHMNDTRQFIRKQDSVRVAAGYGEDGTYNGPWDFEAFAPAGGIRSTAADMLRYAKANLGDAPPRLLKDMQLTHTVTFTNGNSTVALGWHYIKPGTDQLLWHNGGTGGYRSYLGINMDKKFAVVVLSNTAIGTESVGNAIVKYLEKNPQ